MTPQQQIKARHTWLKICQEWGAVSVAARRCGIARSTLYRWLKRYQQNPRPEALLERSRRPKRLARLKVTLEDEQLIAQIRQQRRYEKKRIASSLLHHNRRLSASMVGRVVRAYPEIGHPAAENTPNPLKGAFRKGAFRTPHFQAGKPPSGGWGYVRIGSKPRSPHLNGKVERTQQTDLQEFCALHNLITPALKQHLSRWQDFYNYPRPHRSPNGKAPIERVSELASFTPSWAEVQAL